MNPTINTELFFNFKDTNGDKKPMLFKDPIEIVCASTIDDVLPCLTKVQRLVDEGYYAAGYVAYEAAPAFDADFRVNKDRKSVV